MVEENWKEERGWDETWYILCESEKQIQHQQQQQQQQQLQRLQQQQQQLGNIK